MSVDENQHGFFQWFQFPVSCFQLFQPGTYHPRQFAFNIAAGTQNCNFPFYHVSRCLPSGSYDARHSLQVYSLHPTDYPHGLNLTCIVWWHQNAVGLRWLSLSASQTSTQIVSALSPVPLHTPPAVMAGILLYCHADCLHRATAAAWSKNLAQHATCSPLTEQLQVFISPLHKPSGQHGKQTVM